jgi:quercetin dioxygenase-like cupin family protein
MRSFRARNQQAIVFLAASAITTLVAIAAYAALPSRSVEPINVGIGTLAGRTSVNVLSADAFLKAISQEHGTNAVLQHLAFEPGQSTLWHRHPGPNLVLVVGGSLTLTDEHCRTLTYSDGQGFATGLRNHLAVAGAHGADFYSLYFLPGQADVLRTPPAGESLAPPRCAER